MKKKLKQKELKKNKILKTISKLKNKISGKEKKLSKIDVKIAGIEKKAAKKKAKKQAKKNTKETSAPNLNN